MHIHTEPTWVVSRVDFISPVDVAGAEEGPVSLRHEARLMGGCMRSQQLWHRGNRNNKYKPQ
jgi:hypothetical protein